MRHLMKKLLSSLTISITTGILVFFINACSRPPIPHSKDCDKDKRQSTRSL